MPSKAFRARRAAAKAEGAAAKPAASKREALVAPSKVVDVESDVVSTRASTVCEPTAVDGLEALRTKAADLKAAFRAACEVRDAAVAELRTAVARRSSRRAELSGGLSEAQAAKSRAVSKILELRAQRAQPVLRSIKLSPGEVAHNARIDAEIAVFEKQERAAKRTIFEVRRRTEVDPEMRRLEAALDRESESGLDMARDRSRAAADEAYSAWRECIDVEIPKCKADQRKKQWN
jgi:hypothetical protein